MVTIFLNIVYLLLSKKLLSMCVSVAARSRLRTQPNDSLPDFHVGTFSPYVGFLSLAVLTPGVLYGVFILNIALPVAGLGGAIPLLWISEQNPTWFDWVTQGIAALTWACMGYLCGLSFAVMFHLGRIVLAGALLIAAVSFPMWGDTPELKALRESARMGKPVPANAHFLARPVVAGMSALYFAGEQLHLIGPRPLTPEFIDEHITGVWTGKLHQTEKPFYVRFSRNEYTAYTEQYFSSWRYNIRFEGNQKQIGFRELGYGNNTGPLESVTVIDHDTLDHVDTKGRHHVMHRVRDIDGFTEKAAAAEKIKLDRMPPALRRLLGK